jgi:hypothetical protein
VCFELDPERVKQAPTPNAAAVAGVQKEPAAPDGGDMPGHAAAATTTDDDEIPND